MPPIIIDSDDENIDALSDHDHIDAEPGRREEIIERPQDDRTQSTGSTGECAINVTRVQDDRLLMTSVARAHAQAGSPSYGRLRDA